MTIMAKVAVVAIIAAVAVAQGWTPPVDPCAQYPTCEQCVSQHLCGWCSQDVIYPGPVPGTNITGKQCAGFNPNGKDPFQCNGIYSTEQCVSGYVCNQDTYQCEKGKPGSGNTLAKCEANCSSEGKVFKCNTTTRQCYHVPDGTAGSTSLAVCEASCKHPSHHPSSPGPAGPPTPAKTYSCNTTTGQCVEAKPGHGTSRNLCEQGCKKGEEKYLCVLSLHKCVKLPPLSPGGVNLTTCEESCNPQPNPNPPSSFVGMWRGLEVQKNYKAGEWDINITQTTATLINVAAATTIKGVPMHIENTLVIKVTAGPGAGQNIKVKMDTDGRGPETYFTSWAMGAPGKDAPASILSGMSGDDGAIVLALAKCVSNVDCVFTMPSTMMKQRKAAAQSVKVADANTDHCSQYSSNCSYCLAHEFCGWCSTDVIYKDGTKGTQCAGFNSAANSTNSFVCNGRYSTLDCNVGYTCDKAKVQCVPNSTPGDGLPKAECEELCKPTPSPTPKIQEYACNVTERKCYKCTEEYCPGGMPESTCAAACVKPKPGPTGLVKGLWRGLEIQNNYPIGEVDLVQNASSVTFYRNGKMVWKGTQVSYGGDATMYHIKEGENAGKSVSAIYSVADQGQLWSWMTIAFSAPGGSFPSGYEAPMTASGDKVMIFAKCGQSQCHFNQPQ